MPTKIENLKGVALDYVPESIKAEKKLETFVHAYIVNGMLLASIFMCLGGFLLQLLTSEVTFKSALYGIVLSGFCITFYYVALRVFHRTASFLMAGNIYAATSYIGIFVAAVFTGGYDSPVVNMLLTIPVIVFMMSGRAMGVMWMVLVLLGFAALFYMHMTGFEGQQIQLTDYNRLYISMFTLGMLGIVVMVGMLVFDLINRNLTARLEQERNHFAFQAAHDSLTKIANRPSFEQGLREVIDRCKTTDQKAAIVYIDLDNFKPVNDQYGHHAGDVVLQAAAKRIVNAVRETDLVARLGGDEFAMILYNVDKTENVNKILSNIVDQLSSPIRTDEATVTVTASIGAVLCPDHGTDPETLQNLADELMYKAKKQKNAFVFAG